MVLIFGVTADILRVKNDIIKSHVKKYNFKDKLRFWNFNYTIILKLALIELETMEQHRKMANFMRWMFEEFYFGAPATLFANYYFANKAKMKGLKSCEEKRVFATLKNMTWDLTLLTQWVKAVEKQKETNTIWLLCSQDKTLMKLARCLIIAEQNESISEEKTKNNFVENWGNKKGLALYEIYLNYRQTCNDKSRVANKGFPSQYFEDIRIKFERELLEKIVKRENKN